MKAYKALTDKISTDNISQYFLSKYFTLSEFQKVYEIILGHKIDKRNFRKDIVQKYNLKATPKKEFDVAHRPAVLYKFG